MECRECGIEFEGRKDAKFCSPKCRVTFSRKASVVTDNVTFKPADVTDNFEFYTITKVREPLPVKSKDEDERSEVRTAGYWYDVPLGAIPVVKKDWPPMPDYMNGRQYFLWWKNNFEEGKSGPIILDPYPRHENVIYKQGKGAGA